MPIIDRAGFQEVLQFCQNNPNVFKTSEIMEYLQGQGMTSGAATGTIRRACECRLLRKVGRAQYQCNAEVLDSLIAADDSPLVTVRQILINAADQINNSVKLSDISSAEEAAELIRINQKLQSLISSIR